MNDEKIIKINEIYFKMFSAVFIVFLGGVYILFDAVAKFEGTTYLFTAYSFYALVFSTFIFLIQSIKTILYLKNNNNPN
jgi:hypothetical protein